jgi:hypothetical protein
MRDWVSAYAPKPKTPNPQSPIPNPHLNLLKIKKLKIIKNNKKIKLFIISSLKKFMK